MNDKVYGYHRKWLNDFAVTDEVIDQDYSCNGTKLHMESYTNKDQKLLLRFPYTDGEDYSYLIVNKDGPKDSRYVFMSKVFEGGYKHILGHIRPIAGRGKILLCEGFKQSLAVASHAPQDYGVLMYPGDMDWDNVNLTQLKELEVTIIVDSDYASNRGVQANVNKMRKALKPYASVVSVLYPPNIRGAKKTGIDDWLTQFRDSFQNSRLEDLLLRVSGKQLYIDTYEGVKIEQYEWYDRYWLPRIGLVGLAGPPDAGKSTYIAHQIKFLTTHFDVQCLLLSAEEDEGYIKARLDAFEIDPTKVYRVKIDRGQFMDNIDLAKDMRHIQQIVRDFGISAVFIDPASSFIGVREDTQNYSELRAKLVELSDFANSNRVLLEMVKHLRKDLKLDTMPDMQSMVYGSQAWTEVPRSFPILWPLKSEKLRASLDLEDDEVTTLLLRSKMNNTPHDLPAKAFKLGGKWNADLVEEVSFIEELGTRAISSADIVSRSVETTKDTSERKQKQRIELARIMMLCAAKSPISLKELKEASEIKVQGTFNNRLTVLKQGGYIEQRPVEGAEHNEQEIVFCKPYDDASIL